MAAHLRRGIAIEAPVHVRGGENSVVLPPDAPPGLDHRQVRALALLVDALILGRSKLNAYVSMQTGLPEEVISRWRRSDVCFRRALDVALREHREEARAAALVAAPEAVATLRRGMREELPSDARQCALAVLDRVGMPAANQAAVNVDAARRGGRGRTRRDARIDGG